MNQESTTPNLPSKRAYSAPRLSTFGSVVSITKGSDPTGTVDGAMFTMA